MHRARIIAGTLTLLASTTVEPLLGLQNTSTPAYSRQPAPQGKRIVAEDGDLVVVEGDARVKFVRRRHAIVRLIFNGEERWALLLADFVRDGRNDGRVDFQYSWRQVEGTWPIEPRWEGTAVVEDYAYPNQRAGGWGVVVPAGRIQFLPGSGIDQNADAEPNALAVVRHRGAGGGTASGTFDEAEQRTVAELRANMRRDESGGAAVSTFTNGTVTGGLTFGVTPRSGSEPITYSTVSPGPAAGGPVRVGGNIAMPRRIHDVAAVYPEAARQAGVGGIVVLELTLAADGTVSEVRVLRSIPLLDQAAVEAARQWRYETTRVNGVLVPVRFTATVNFSQ